MTRVATRRLMEASATLDAADRALLNIWVNRGLDDRALARMTGLDDAAVAARRVRIVTRLSATLGLPPETVRGALDEIAASAERGPIVDRSTPPTAVIPGAEEPEPPAAKATGHADAAARAVEGPVGDSTSRSRRWRWGLPLIAIIVAVILIAALESGRSPRRSPDAAGAAVSADDASRATTASAPAPAASPPAATKTSPGDRLVVLAGGPAHATGIVLVTGSQSDLKLHVSVSNLPAPAHGHYELWLYDSIIYARDLGRLRPGVSQMTLRLPPNARRFRWIDLSFQPSGAIFHSGESLLRSPNPLFRRAAR